jgi:hypothetical protein
LAIDEPRMYANTDGLLFYKLAANIRRICGYFSDIQTTQLPAIIRIILMTMDVDKLRISGNHSCRSYCKF